MEDHLAKEEIMMVSFERKGMRRIIAAATIVGTLCLVEIGRAHV